MSSDFVVDQLTPGLLIIWGCGFVVLIFVYCWNWRRYLHLVHPTANCNRPALQGQSMGGLAPERGAVRPRGGSPPAQSSTTLMVRYYLDVHLVATHRDSESDTTPIFVFIVAGTAIEKVPTCASGGGWLV